MDPTCHALKQFLFLFFFYHPYLLPHNQKVDRRRESRISLWRAPPQSSFAAVSSAPARAAAAGEQPPRVMLTVETRNNLRFASIRTYTFFTTG
jgi:hypothetical protein